MSKTDDIENKSRSDSGELSEVDARILKAVSEVNYGSVEITIHHGRVVQVERREKIRLSNENAKKEQSC